EPSPSTTTPSTPPCRSSARLSKLGDARASFRPTPVTAALAPPNGSRLSCGRLGRRRKGVGRQTVPARAQHSAPLKRSTPVSFKRLLGSALTPLRDLSITLRTHHDHQPPDTPQDKPRAKPNKHHTLNPEDRPP